MSPTFAVLPSRAPVRRVLVAVVAFAAVAALAKVKELVSDPKLPKTIANLERTLSRVDRILGAGEADLATTIENLRQITDNLRDLTEDTKRYPANVIFGTPPRPLERAQ